jgi:hypothetical protein
LEAFLPDQDEVRVAGSPRRSGTLRSSRMAPGNGPPVPVRREIEVTRA